MSVATAIAAGDDNAFRVVAFLQNMWFKNPERMKHQLATTYGGDREAFIRQWLFWSCLTGRRLQIAFTTQGCDRIVWEEVSKEIGGESSAKFPPDKLHIREVLDRHAPHVCLAFGKIAESVLGDPRFFLGYREPPKVLIAPHPAARGASIVPRLREVARELERLRGLHNSGARG